MSSFSFGQNSFGRPLLETTYQLWLCIKYSALSCYHNLSGSAILSAQLASFLASQYSPLNSHRSSSSSVMALLPSLFLLKTGMSEDVDKFEHFCWQLSNFLGKNLTFGEKLSNFHKNHPANLLTLCEGCHLNIHKSGKQHKKIKTSIGIEIEEMT